MSPPASNWHPSGVRSRRAPRPHNITPLPIESGLGRTLEGVSLIHAAAGMGSVVAVSATLLPLHRGGAGHRRVLARLALRPRRLEQVHSVGDLAAAAAVVDILRRASPEFHDLDGKIGLADDVLLLPLVSQCDAALWDAPDEFRRGGTSLTPKPT